MIVVLGLGVAFGAAIAGAAPDDADVERTIADGEVAPGESTTVTVDISLGEEGAESVELEESFDPAFESATVVGDDGGTAVASDDEVIASWFAEEDELFLEYEVTVPANATAGDTFDIAGDVTVDEEGIEISGDTTIEVFEPEEASVTFEEQSTTGESVTVAEAGPGADGEALAVWSVEDGAPDALLAVEDDFEAVLEDTELALDPPIENDQELIVAVHDGEPTADNILVSDSAAVSITEDEPDEFAERSIEHTELAAGESTTVTVTAGFSEEADDIAAGGEFDPIVESTAFEGSDPFPDVQNFDEEGYGVIFSDTDSVEYTYEVTIPEDAEDGDSFTFDGDIGTDTTEDDLSITGDQEITVTETPAIEGELVVEDQANPAGDQVVVEEATASVEHAVVIEADGEELGSSNAFDADHTASDLEIELDEPLDETADITVQVVSVEDGELGPPLVTADGELETTIQLEVGVDAYADNGEVGPTAVFEAIGDWRDDRIDPSLVFDVISAWRE